MALAKEIETQFGITASYWRLDNIRYLKQENILSFSLMGYPSSEISQIENVTPLENRGFSFVPTNANWTGDIRVACYSIAKDSAEFEDAEDV